MNLIITHDSADFDAIASSLLLTKIFKNSVILKPNSFEEAVLNFIKRNPETVKFINKNEIKNNNISRVIFTDRDKNEKLLDELELSNIPVEVYDHHQINGYGSNVSLLYYKFKNKLKKLTKEEALLAILGIYQDTGNLTYKSTHPIDFEASSFFLRFNPNIEKIPFYIRLFQIDIEGIKIIHKILDNGNIIGPPSFKIFISYYISEKYYYGYSILLNHMISLLGLKMIFVFIIYKNKFFIIGRNNFKVDINIFLNKLKKGGGHKYASTRVIVKEPYKPYYRKLQFIITDYVFKQPLSLYIKDIKWKKYKLNHKPDNFIESNILLWDYFDIFAKGEILPIKYGKFYLNAEIYREILPEEVIKPILLPEKERKKYPILLNVKRYMHMVLDKNLQEYINILSNLSKQEKMSVYLVGGFPRDLLLAYLLNKKNLLFKEIDVVVSGGNSINFAKKFYQKVGGKFSYYEAFKTATIKLPDLTIDFATARLETYEKQGALPNIQITNIFNDLKRRDFTINSMAIDISKEHYGLVIDFFGGQRDLKNHILRILHPKSFFDDPTRIFRLIRFKNSLNFKIEKNTEQLLNFSTKFGILESLKGVRITREIKYLFNSFPVQSLKDMKKYRLLYELFGVDDLDFSQLSSLNTIINWFKIIEPSLKIKKDIIYFGHIFRLAKNKHDNLFSFSNKEWEIIHSIEKITPKKFISENSRFSTFYKHFGKYPLETQIYVSILFSEKIREKYLSYMVKLINFRPLIDGNDCKKMGIKDEQIGKALNFIKFKQLDGKIHSKEEALKLIHQRFMGM